MKFRKKPVVIEAMQWDGSSKKGLKLLRWMRKANEGKTWREFDCDCTAYGIHIRTLEGEVHAKVGDWIIKGVKGEFYPCKPDIFEMTYEPV